MSFIDLPVALQLPNCLLQSPAHFLDNVRRVEHFMKIMAFGDIHEYLHPLASLAEPLQQADMVLVTGDMTRWRGPETATKVLQAILAL